MKNLSELNFKKVKIYVWKMDLRLNRVGHTSLQTFGDHPIYASYWPDEETIGRKLKSGVKGTQPRNLQMGSRKTQKTVVD